MRRARPMVTCLFVAAALLAAATARAEPWGPWSVTSDSPAMLSQADRMPRTPRTPPEQSIAATPFLWMLTFYQNLVSPLDGDRCPMYPTCSAYSVQAIRKHGPFMGIIMTADRLIHEADEQRFAPLVKMGDRYRYADPVAGNDFWWYRP